MSLLVQDKDLILITVYYTLKVNKYGVKFVKVLKDSKAKEMLADPELAPTVKMLNTKWKQLSWLAQNELFSNSMRWDSATGRAEIEVSKFRDAQLKSFLVDWDLTDDQNRPYPVTEDTINALHATVAGALSDKYTEATSLEDGEMGELDG